MGVLMVNYVQCYYHEVTTHNIFPTEPINSWTAASSKKGVYGFYLLHSISFYSLWGQSSEWIFDGANCNQVKPSDFNIGRHDGISKIRDLHQSLLFSLLPPGIPNHSSFLTHIDHVRAEHWELEWCRALCVKPRHLRKSGLITSFIPSDTLYHVAIAYLISVNEMLLCPTLLPLTPKWSNHNPLLVKLHDCNFSRLWTPASLLNESTQSFTLGQNRHKMQLITQS